MFSTLKKTLSLKKRKNGKIKYEIDSENVSTECCWIT